MGDIERPRMTAGTRAGGDLPARDADLEVSVDRGILAAALAVLAGVFEIVEGLTALLDREGSSAGLHDSGVLGSTSGWWHLAFGVLVLLAGLTVAVRGRRVLRR